MVDGVTWWTWRHNVVECFDQNNNITYCPEELNISVDVNFGKEVFEGE